MSQPASAWSSLWRVITRFDAEKITPAIALRNAIGVTFPLAVGYVSGQLPAALAVSVGALNVAFTDGSEPYRVRGARMLAATLLVGLAVALAETCGNHPALAVTISVAWAFAAGLLVCLSSTAADLGVVSLVTLVVYCSVPASPERAVLAGLAAIVGGLFQTALSLALWPLRRYAPERRVIAALYRELARSAAEPRAADAAPAASAHSTEAAHLVETLARDRTIEGERYRALLGQGERLRLSLIALGGACPEFGRAASTILEAASDSLESGARITLAPGAWEPFATLRSAESGKTRQHMDAALGQLRAIADLAGRAAPQGTEEFAAEQGRLPWRLRMSGAFAILRANLTLESTACRHAIRMAVCVAIADALARFASLERAYWMPMTVAIVLKPDFSATISRGVLRLAGTFAGMLLATAIFHLLPAGAGLEVVLIGVFLFLMRAFGPANYGVFTVAVTALVVLLLALGGMSPGGVTIARGVNTAIGGAIALAAYAAWPTWEREQTPETLAHMLDAYRDYFRAVRKAYEDPDAPQAIDPIRQRARLARSNLEAAVDRMAAEPGTPREWTASLTGIIAESHRLVHAVMALEAGLSTSAPVPPRPPFAAFANAVEFTLYDLAHALRGSPVAADELPDVRARQVELSESMHAPAARYELVNLETDRLTNSLNSLAEEILERVHKPGSRAGRSL